MGKIHEEAGRSGTSRRLVAAAVVVTAVATSACGTTTTDVDTDSAITVESALDQMELARVTRVRDDYQRAEESLRWAAEVEPADLELQVALGLSLFARHAFDDVLVIADRVLAVDADHAAALALRGDVRLAIGDAAGAAADHRRLHAVASSPASLIRLAHGVEESGDPRSALELVSRAVAELESIESASGVEPEGEAAAWYRWRLGDLHRHLGDTATAQPWFEEALRIQPDYVLAYDGLIDVAITEGRFDDAAALLAEWPEGSSIRIEAALGLAEAEGDELAARAHRGRLIAQLEADDPVAAGLDLASALLDADIRRAEALDLTFAELGRRRNAATLAVHARALLVNDRVDDALETVELMLATGTNEPDRIAVAADVLRAAGQPERVAQLPGL